MKIWFQNRRSKQKKLSKGNGERCSEDEDSNKDTDMSPPNSVATSLDGGGSSLSNAEENHRNLCNTNEASVMASSSTPVSLPSNLINPVPVSSQQQQPLPPPFVPPLLGVDSSIDWNAQMNNINNINMLPSMANTLASTSLSHHPHMHAMQLSPHQLGAATATTAPQFDPNTFINHLQHPANFIEKYQPGGMDMKNFYEMPAAATYYPHPYYTPYN